MVETLYYSMAALISYTMREQHQPMILKVDDRDNTQLQGHNLAAIFEIIEVGPWVHEESHPCLQSWREISLPAWFRPRTKERCWYQRVNEGKEYRILLLWPRCANRLHCQLVHGFFWFFLATCCFSYWLSIPPTFPLVYWPACLISTFQVYKTLNWNSLFSFRGFSIEFCKVATKNFIVVRFNFERSFFQSLKNVTLRFFIRVFMNFISLFWIMLSLSDVRFSRLEVMEVASCMIVPANTRWTTLSAFSWGEKSRNFFQFF